MKKTALILICLLCAAVLAGCSSDQDTKLSSDQKDAIVSSVQSSGNITLTADQLAAFDGRNGRPAYIALDGMIYDVSNIKEWKGGSHHGCHAGQDITEAFKNSPHDSSIMKGVPAIGKLTD